MNLTNELERRLEATIVARLHSAFEPAIHQAMMDVLHGKKRKHDEALKAPKGKQLLEDDGRVTRNGIHEPGPGKCRDVWNILDGMNNPESVTLLQAVEKGMKKGCNPNNVRVEFYRWRTFHGYNTAH